LSPLQGLIARNPGKYYKWAKRYFVCGAILLMAEATYSAQQNDHWASIICGLTAAMAIYSCYGLTKNQEAWEEHGRDQKET
jgi:hypothetical protein